MQTHSISSPLVSVVIGAYNAAGSLSATLDSVLAQSVADLECIVVDDASQDGTSDCVRTVAARDPRVRLVSLESNGGLTRALVRGVEEARGIWLARIDAGDEQFGRTLPYGSGDMLPASPVTTRHLGEGSLSIGTLARAIVETSDNTAANLLMRASGGSPALTRFAQSIGDDATRADRYEPDANLYDPLLDTTTPRAMTQTLRRLLLGNVLKPASRRMLEDWMVATTTGENRLRAAMPKGWIAGDKTGTSAARQTNDIAIVRPPGRRPLLIAAYYDGPRVSTAQREQALREVGAAFVTWARRAT